MENDIAQPVVGVIHPWYENGCGVEKGCFAFPKKTCIEDSWCEMLATWKPATYDDEDAYEFQLQLDTRALDFAPEKLEKGMTPYISLALSKDGEDYNVSKSNDLVFMCTPHKPSVSLDTNAMPEVNFKK